MNRAILVCCAVVMMLGAAVFPPATGSAKDNTASSSSELGRILADLEDVVLQLQLENSLDEEQLSSLRRELAVIYRDLKALQQRLDQGGIFDDSDYDRNTWQPYRSAKRELRPDGARFNGWNEYADVSFEFGRYGEIILTIDNFDYEVTWTIQNAYTGQVEARVDAKADGSILLSVEDENGEHEFKVGQGGLGAMTVRGRGGYRAPGTKGTAR